MAGTGEPQSHRARGQSAVLTRAPPLGLAGAHVTSLLDEAAAGPCALRALPAGPQLLERRRRARLVDVTTVGAQPLSRPVAHRLELLRRATHAWREKQGEARGRSVAYGQGGCQLLRPTLFGPASETSSGESLFFPNCMTGAVRTGAARTATAERAICAGANASTEEHKASISIPSDEAIAKVPRQQRRSRGHAQRTTRGA